jgi:hypothetical protein
MYDGSMVWICGLDSSAHTELYPTRHSCSCPTSPIVWRASVGLLFVNMSHMHGKRWRTYFTCGLVPDLRLQGITNKASLSDSQLSRQHIVSSTVPPSLEHINHVWRGFLCKLNTALYKRTDPYVSFCFRPKFCVKTKGKEISSHRFKICVNQF